MRGDRVLLGEAAWQVSCPYYHIIFQAASPLPFSPTHTHITPTAIDYIAAALPCHPPICSVSWPTINQSLFPSATSPKDRK